MKKEYPEKKEKKDKVGHVKKAVKKDAYVKGEGGLLEGNSEVAENYTDGLPEIIIPLDRLKVALGPNLQSNDISLLSIHRFSNGVRVKPIKNRAVTVFKDKNHEGILIEFARADVPKEDINNPTSYNAVHKNKINVTGIALSAKAAAALLACLNDYFNRGLHNETTGKHTGR